ncbi:uncharacterized protein BCR38DRAFT_445844 [Pseudomassariella vexata]|uniref:Uncharacterized protein n=1 Tax=Pseudomassariella vexata TaxID=1141098 RepID=A0A1Y2DIZ0_9PEZI|nr:uncharacterized protein BCR38DRAFT_445844 [Pseudomassariella vexata]ORY59180.1 hypothetical protein BCR38DRAFT_445844 [Pseudomassariella vexata]
MRRLRSLWLYHTRHRQPQGRYLGYDWETISFSLKVSELPRAVHNHPAGPCVGIGNECGLLLAHHTFGIPYLLYKPVFLLITLKVFLSSFRIGSLNVSPDSYSTDLVCFRRDSRISPPNSSWMGRFP